MKKYKFLVTSGGTREKIDEARFISNSSTGELGSLISSALAGNALCEKIFYVCGMAAAIPNTDKAEIIRVSDTDSVIGAVENILGGNDVDGIFHAMAVSDYRVKSVKTSAGAELERGKKINSNENEIILTLEATPKIISFFSRLAPRALLAGFKMLCGVSKKTLTSAAYELLQKNKCAFVIANDKNFITETGHRAYLVDKDKNISEYTTKKEIASGAADKMYSLLNDMRGGLA